jgi:adenosylhomocysteine nucleosidase
MRILFVASDRREFGGILNFTLGVREASSAVDWARAGTLNGNQVLLIAHGAGRKRAAAALDAARRAFAAEHVVSTGFCGALNPELPVGAVVVGTCVASGGARYAAAPVAGIRPFYTGVVCSIDRVAGTAIEKRALRAEGGDVVEMEAAGVAERAEALGLPFSCVRAVTDLASEDLANDFNRALRSDGHFDTMRILRDVLRQPAARLPELIRLQQRCTRAAKSLGEFFADCRF